MSRRSVSLLVRMAVLIFSMCVGRHACAWSPSCHMVCGAITYDVLAGDDPALAHQLAELLRQSALFDEDVRGAPPKPSADPSLATPTTRPTDGPGVVMVQATARGKKYHKETCGSLSKSTQTITLDEAKSRGLQPCGICHPPE